jgi:hypothetical protein
MHATLSLLVASLFAPRPASADVVHADDVIITGRVCAGSADCVTGRVFQGDLELVSGNPEIIFIDNTIGADDWEIEADASDLEIKNRVDGGSTIDVVRLNGGAPGNSLVIDSQGFLGLGTSAPGDELHIRGHIPTIRLQDTAAEGRTWHIAGTFQGFEIQDRTAFTIPLFFYPGAPNNSIVVDSTGNFGSGTSTPSAALHLRRTNGTAKLLVEEANAGQASRTLFQLQNNGEPKFGFTNTAVPQSWEFFASVGFAVNEITNPGLEFVLSPSGSLTIAGSLTTGGPSCGGGCDAVFSPGFEIEPIEEHAARMWEQSHLPAVGPTSPSESLNVSDKIGGLINELEKAHIYIERLNEDAKQQKAVLADKGQRLAELEGRLFRLEALLHPRPGAGE